MKLLIFLGMIYTSNLLATGIVGYQRLKLLGADAWNDKVWLNIDEKFISTTRFRLYSQYEHFVDYSKIYTECGVYKNYGNLRVEGLFIRDYYLKNYYNNVDKVGVGIAYDLWK